MPESAGVHLYRLRHGGASHDVAHRMRTLDEVQKRGSWRSKASVARYAKPARLNEQVLALPSDVQADLQRREKRLAQRMQEML